MTIAWTALILAAFVIGLKYGPEGVAAGFSAMSIVLALPVCVDAIQGTLIRLKDVAQVLVCPTIAISIPCVLGLMLRTRGICGHPLRCVRLRLWCCASSYAFILLVGLRQWGFYRDML